MSLGIKGAGLSYQRRRPVVLHATTTMECSIPRGNSPRLLSPARGAGTSHSTVAQLQERKAETARPLKAGPTELSVPPLAVHWSCKLPDWPRLQPGEFSSWSRGMQSKQGGEPARTSLQTSSHNRTPESPSPLKPELLGFVLRSAHWNPSRGDSSGV